MADRNFRIRLEPMEPRALLSHFDLGGTPEADSRGNSQRSALVGSIQGTETISANGYQLDGTGTVTPLGDVIVIGSFGGGQRRSERQGNFDVFQQPGQPDLILENSRVFPAPQSKCGGNSRDRPDAIRKRKLCRFPRSGDDQFHESYFDKS